MATDLSQNGYGQQKSYIPRCFDFAIKSYIPLRFVLHNKQVYSPSFCFVQSKSYIASVFYVTIEGKGERAFLLYNTTRMGNAVAYCTIRTEEEYSCLLYKRNQWGRSSFIVQSNPKVKIAFVVQLRTSKELVNSLYISKHMGKSFFS